MREFKFFKKGVDISQFDIPQGCILVGVTPVMYEPTSFNQVKAVLYRDSETGRLIKGETISPGHILWDYEGV